MDHNPNPRILLLSEWLCCTSPPFIEGYDLLETFRSLELHVHLPLFGAISSSPFRRWPVFHVASLSPLHTLRYVEMPEQDKAWQRRCEPSKGLVS